ncbi:Permease of the drug/metabolite transporter (DMT) superfamily [Dyella jiangningensis]|uniref:drug/metabolite exporter YedA n=1 Tax=Dyella sp. AtDHG13 TaxID=1938897 RepID=UPI00088F0498|nr:drug/metabolite exporter YedA [Dyella sp. AtDHG13]PXV59662.1 drug/metabolite transporter (DMT)-like permease [Dyella sp. AtDHG13]SDJ28065.1 Permease of the drug/metabolite transporter (DMT) superfamily [Dyella jiangningensis]
MTDTTTANAAPAATSPFADARVLVPLGLFALYIIWGSTYLGIRYALESYPPFLLAGLRFLGAGVALFGFLRLRGVAMPTARQWRNAAVTGILLLGFGNGLVCFAEERVSSGIAAVAVASMPLFAALFSGLYGEWPSRRETVGLVIGFVGVIVLNLGSGLSGSRIGAIALLVAAMSWAFGATWSRRQDMPAGPMNTAAQMLCASVAMLGVGFASGERLPEHPTVRATVALVYLAVFGSIIAFSAFLYVLKHARPALATSYAYVNPPVAVLFGVLLAGESVGPYDLIGMAIILLGVGAITLARQRR